MLKRLSCFKVGDYKMFRANTKVNLKGFQGGEQQIAPLSEPKL